MKSGPIRMNLKFIRVAISGALTFGGFSNYVWNQELQTLLSWNTKLAERLLFLENHKEKARSRAKSPRPFVRALIAQGIRIGERNFLAATSNGTAIAKTSSIPSAPEPNSGTPVDGVTVKYSHAAVDPPFL